MFKKRPPDVLSVKRNEKIGNNRSFKVEKLDSPREKAGLKIIKNFIAIVIMILNY